MRNIFYLAAIILVLQSCQTKPVDSKQEDDNNIIPVKLLAINSDSGSTVVTASGSVATENEAKLSFKIGGIIESILVKEGDRVSAGQLLATLKSTEIAAQVQQVQLSLTKAQRDYQRVNNLFLDSVATLEQLQNAKTGVDIAKENMQQVLFNQQYSKIYAPVAGFVSHKLGNAGELASPGAPIIILNAQSATNSWILKAGLSDKEWAAVSIGNKASVQVDAFPGELFTAVVSKKALSAEAVSGSFPVELKIDFDKAKPAAGMFARATIHSAQASSGYNIPFEALLEANGSNGFVFVTNDKKTVKKISVTISGINNNTAYISNGLQGYSYVVTSGSPYLADNSLISVTQ
jgi:RND family efflux transporter MFP subunit